jgi:hypothetical protein
LVNAEPVKPAFKTDIFGTKQLHDLKFDRAGRNCSGRLGNVLFALTIEGISIGRK